jgi:hypothetical protein
MKSETTTIRLTPEVKSAAQKAAEAEHRSLSSLTEIALIEWLRANGYLKPEKRK